MEHLIEDTLDALEESQRLFAEIVLEDKSAYVPVCTLALATLTKLTGDIRDAGEMDDVLDTMGERIAFDNLNDPVFGVHDDVIEAVIEACEASENGELKEWMIDAIMTKIVERHPNKALKKAQK
jgi:hypothetical protein